MGLHVGLLRDALPFVQDGSSECFALRKADDPHMALEVSYRVMEEGSGLCLWACEQQEWSCRFRVNVDGTVSPWEAWDGGSCQDGLVVGVEPGTGQLLLVPSHDTERRMEVTASTPRPLGFPI